MLGAVYDFLVCYHVHPCDGRDVWPLAPYGLADDGEEYTTKETGIAHPYKRYRLGPTPVPDLSPFGRLV